MKGKFIYRIAKFLPFTASSAASRTVYKELDKKAITLLDIGCGEGSPVFLSIKKVNLYSVGLDLFAPSLKVAKERKIYSELVRGDARSLPFKVKSFDVVFALEVLEHLPKEKGKAFLSELERIALKQIILTTPFGYSPQGKVKGNPFQVHRSGWLPYELEEMEYKVIPISFRYPKPLAYESVLRTALRYAFTVLLQPFIKIFPGKFARGMVAIKNLKESKT